MEKRRKRREAESLKVGVGLSHIFNKTVLTDKVLFVQKLKGSKGLSHATTWNNSITYLEKSTCKTLRCEHDCSV